MLKKSERLIMKELKIEDDDDDGVNHMSVEFASNEDGKEGMVKAANFIFAQNLKSTFCRGCMGKNCYYSQKVLVE